MKSKHRMHSILNYPLNIHGIPKLEKPAKTLMDHIKNELNIIQMNRDDQGHWLRAEQLLEKIEKAGL